jgi:hypothetical protein
VKETNGEMLALAFICFQPKKRFFKIIFREGGKVEIDGGGFHLDPYNPSPKCRGRGGASRKNKRVSLLFGRRVLFY